MSLFQLPIDNDFVSYQQSQGLDGTKLSFKFTYNGRNDTWYIEVIDDFNVTLLGPKPCLSNVIGQVSRIKPYAIPIGGIIFLDVSDLGLDCTFDNFGSAIGLFYQNVD